MANWTRWHTFALLIIVLAILFVGLLVRNNARFWGWVGTMVLLFAFISIASDGITSSSFGWLIDKYYKMSLSRLQMTVWTVIVLSGYFMAALANLSAQQSDSLSVAIPRELWLLMGISTASLVASPLIKSNKEFKRPNTEEMTQNLELVRRQGNPNKKDHKGVIVTNTEMKDAQWSDLFKGDEIGNVAVLDLSKIQMFFFTLILVLAYATALGSTFASITGRISELPALDPSAVALLGISHAGYLTNKAIPHSQPPEGENRQTP